MNSIYQFILSFLGKANLSAVPDSESAEGSNESNIYAKFVGRKYIQLRHGKKVKELTKLNEYVVFLCGPSLVNRDKMDGAAIFREKIKEALDKSDFEVFLGEDDGLEELRKKYAFNAQDNELLFVQEECDAVVIIPSSVGSFCELGLFTWHYVNQDGKIIEAKRNKKELKFIAVVDEQYKGEKSYFSEGPISALEGVGEVHYVDYNASDITKDVDRIKVILENSRRGRPKY